MSVHEWSTGSQRSSSEGKPDFTLIDSELLKQLAFVLEYGKKRYPLKDVEGNIIGDGRGNWRLGQTYNRCLASAMRHLQAVKDGGTLDVDSDLPNLAHAAASIMFLMRYMKDGRDDLDDRDKV